MTDPRRLAASRYTFDPATAETASSHGIMIQLIGRDQSVLDVGCASGDLARALTQRGCRVTGIEVDPVAAEAARPDLEHLVVGDLEQMDLVSALDGRTFDVVVFGDVLEHVRDPLQVLQQAPALLRPGGAVVVSIPNVAHSAVRLSLLLGDFTYRETGLLDETHLRFFTRLSVMELLDSAGLVPVDVRRTELGPFDSEIPLTPQEVPRDALDLVMQDPEAITYQFVVRAEVAGEAARQQWRQEHAAAEQERADALTSALAAQEDVRSALGRERAARRELEQLLGQARAELEQARADAAAQARAAAEAGEALTAVLGSTAWRISAPVRALGPLRTAVQGPAGRRRSLRRPGAWAAAGRSLREHGVRATAQRVREELGSGHHQQAYDEWVSRWGTLTAADREAISRQVEQELAEGPVVSVVVPVYDTDPQLLRAAVESVRGQLYPRWELHLVDDCSPSAATGEELERLAQTDSRISVHRRSTNGGIAAATNDALRQATGELVAFMDHDDLLAPHALYLVARELVEHPEAAVVYSDEDKLDQHGRRYDPHFKPDFDPELLLAQNYISHLTVMRRSLVVDLGGLDEDLDGSQDHDLVLRATERLAPHQIRHLPWVLYHWRQWAGSGTFSSRRLQQSTSASRAAVSAHLARRGETDVDVVPAPGQPSWNRVVRRPRQPLQEVTAVVPTRDRLPLLRACVEGLLHRTDHDGLHVLIADNDSREPDTLRYLSEISHDPRVTVLAAPGPFNYSRINNHAVEHVRTPLTLLLNNDIVVREPDWLNEMVSLLEVPGTGAVGAKLLYGDGRVQHAGVILGIGGVAGHSHKHYPGSSPGYFGRLLLNQTVSAATGACLLLRTSTYRDVGGLNETDLAVAFNDVDLCLRVGQAGLRVTYAAGAVLDHLESASRGAETTPEQVRRFNAEADWMRDRWGELLHRDPAYNPNLTDVREDFTLAARPRVVRPWERT